MCGRFTLTTPAAEWAALFELDPVPDFEPRYNIAPTQQVAAVRSLFRAQHEETRSERGERDGETREFAKLRWGLVPHWAKEPDLKGRTLINARSETVAERPSFRDSFRFRRCLVVADGFYEWQPAGARKQPYWIRLDTEAPFAFAGLWDAWTDGSEMIESCTILTTEANEALRPIHDRMPVILDPASYDAWIDPETPNWDLERLLTAWPSESMLMHPVSTHVNHVGHDDPSCIVPERPQTDLFG
ncbi:MAG: SOS response-associated peptidase [marine benthic group bacterium]|jgi:putative SOS response-associated peptidase YedK|nr:SOS response-associated peptidase [Gemmatimonadota bacterium]MCL7962707.1 SOS response-associated peptidase [Candidatus Carthagonibacter metallireducens]MCL7969534.1 SOS response-associated peptidase [Gemmatimonadota bacterium]MCL7975635.1 SOS response-associated peptidase [Gemmatimonadota bacterium]MCL7978234.1 SOS response-associated peptidase [Gemmatimonadota bacterium]